MRMTMSSISFRTRSKEALVGGRERAWLGSMIVEGVGASVFRPDEWARYNRRNLSKVFSGKEWELEYLFKSLHNPITTWAGKEWNSFEVMLNTAILLGSDAVKLAAIIHGTCELNAYFAKEDLEWLADTIEGSPHIFRPETQGYDGGWADVISLARSTRGKLTMSYSVTGQSKPAFQVEPDTVFDEGLTMFDVMDATNKAISGEDDEKSKN